MRGMCLMLNLLSIFSALLNKRDSYIKRGELDG